MARRATKRVKPLATTLGGVEHGGHDKIYAFDDPAYQDVLSRIERWADGQPS